MMVILKVGIILLQHGHGFDMIGLMLISLSTVLILLIVALIDKGEL